jgi:subtilase family serine protease
MRRRKQRSRVLAGTALAATVIAMAAAGPVANAYTMPGGGSGGSGGSGASGASTATLPDSVAPFVATSTALRAVPAASTLSIQFWLAPRSPAAAQSYATAVSTPGNPLFGHFLSPAQYASRFGATDAEASSVESWLKSAGFTGVGPDSGHDYVRATAPVATIDRALQVQVRYYRPTGAASAGAYPLRANDRPVSLPASLAGGVLGVTGLDNADPVMTYARPGSPSAAGVTKGNSPTFPCSQWYLQHYTTKLPAQYGATTFPTLICGYTGQQLRRAYGYSGVNDGKGVTIALVEVGLAPYMFQTLSDYARVNAIAAPSAQRYTELSLGRGSTCGDPFNTEEQLDVESAYDLAPMANELVVGGDSCDNGDSGLQALYDADLAVINGTDGHPLARIVSNSWGAGDETLPANLLSIEHNYLIRAADEGISMLFSSGDFSGVQVPASDPFATSVGGTTLGIGHSNPRLFETGWSTGISSDTKGPGTKGHWAFQGEQSAAGGGPSLLWKQPAYQSGAVPASLAVPTGNRGGLVRTAPDISAVADPYTGMAIGILNTNSKGMPTTYTEEPVGGTSLAAPLVAAIVADAEQGTRPFGFLNPALYELARSTPAAFYDVQPLTASTPARYRGVACDAATCGQLSLTTFDDQSWSMQGYTGQVTRPGYDSMTGLGTPNGQRFIGALRHR